MILPIEETLTELANSEQPLLNAKLTELSNLNSAELKCFQHWWATTEVKRRRQIVYRLVELAENNLELNFDSIFKHCLQDKDDEVLIKAIEGLWENEEASLIDQLINLLGTDSSEEVQTSAAILLGKFTILAEDKKLRSCYLLKIQDALLAVISDQSKPVAVRRRTLEASSPLSLPQVKTAITEAYQSHHPRSRVSSIYAMGKNCNPYWLPILRKELGSADIETSYEAASACGEMEEEATVPHLTKLVNDPDVDIQMAAIQALGKIGGTMAKECLESCLDSVSGAVRQAAEQALLELETKADQLPFRL